MKYIAITVFIILCGLIYTFVVYNKKDDETMTTQTFISEISSTVEINCETQSTGLICVYICGCVMNPGIYNVDDNTRLYTLIEMAGGFTEDASNQYLNLADIVIDGQKIEVPSISDVESGNFSNENSSMTELKESLVNINTASEEILMTLPGIGQTRAADIITYRINNGKFNSIEDIMNVEGIKESIFNRIKELIKV